MHQYEDLLVDALLDRGFTVDEAMRLIELQNRIERERREAEEQRRIAQWLASASDNQFCDE
jgi:hypothetical protein